jgi:predicted ATPase
VSELKFYDRVEKTSAPVRILILGARGAGKNTFLQLLKELNPRFEGVRYENARKEGREDYNVCVGVPDQDTLDEIRSHNVITHKFWIDSGDRVEQEEGYEYDIQCDPHRMIIVDNSGTIEDFKAFEVKFCYEMLNIVKEDRNDGQPTQKN